MEKRLIYVDRGKMNDFIISVKDASGHLNEISKQLKAIGITGISIEEMVNGVKRSFKEPKKETVLNWLKELKVSKVQNPEIAGVKISREKLIEMVEISEDISKIENALSRASHILDGETPMLVKRYLKLGNDGEVNTIESHKKLIQEHCTKHTTNERQNIALEHIQSMISSINAVEKIAEKKGESITIDSSSPLFKLPYFSYSDSGIAPNVDYILSL